MSTLDTDAIARRLNAARLSLEGRSREANAFAPSDAETYAVYAVQEYVGDIAALLAEVATLQTALDRMTILYTSRFPGGTEEPQK